MKHTRLRKVIYDFLQDGPNYFSLILDECNRKTKNGTTDSQLSQILNRDPRFEKTKEIKKSDCGMPFTVTVWELKEGATS